MNSMSPSNARLQGLLLDLLEPGQPQRIQDVVAALPECQWAQIFKAIEALSQNHKVLVQCVGSELELIAFPNRKT